MSSKSLPFLTLPLEISRFISVNTQMDIQDIYKVLLSLIDLLRKFTQNILITKKYLYFIAKSIHKTIVNSYGFVKNRCFFVTEQSTL